MVFVLRLFPWIALFLLWNDANNFSVRLNFLTLTVSCCYEVLQLIAKKPKVYFSEPTNYLDMIGCAAGFTWLIKYSSLKAAASNDIISEELVEELVEDSVL